MDDPFITGFLKIIRILKDYLSVIVIGGGWVSIVIDNVIEVTVDDTLSVEDPSALKVKVPTPPAYIFHNRHLWSGRGNQL